MKKENPLVSIVVRTKDRPKLLVRALQSIANQTYLSIEVVLVNDGGCDLNIQDLKSILGVIRINYIRLAQNKGRAGAGNIGIENSEGKYIGFLDDDDEFYPEHVALLVSALEQIDYKIAYTDSELAFIEYDSEKKEFYEKEKKAFSKKDFSYADLIVENYIPLINLLFRKEILVSIGGFDETLELFEDWDLLIRSAEIDPFYHIKKVTSKYMQWSKDLQIAQPEGYQRLSEIAYDKVIFKHKDKYNSLDVVRHFREIAHELVHASFLLNEKNEIISNKNAIILEKNSKIIQCEDVLREKEQLIPLLESKITQYDLQIDQLKYALKEKDSQIGEVEKIIEGKDNQINQVEKIIQGKETQIIQFGKIIKRKDIQLVEFGEIIKRKDEQISHLESQANLYKSQMVQSENTHKGKENRLVHFENIINEKDAQIHKLKSRVAQLEALIAEEIKIVQLEATINKKDTLIEEEIKIAQLEAIVNEKDVLIATMANTIGWQLLVKFRKTRDRFLPDSSRRRNFYNKSSNILRDFITCGLSGLKGGKYDKTYYPQQELQDSPIIENKREKNEELLNVMPLNKKAFDGVVNMKAGKTEIAEKLKELKLELFDLIEFSKNKG